MNRENLLRSIGGISDELVAEAAHSGKRVARMRRSTVFALAAALVMLLGVSTFAASNIVSRHAHSRSVPDYFSVPTRETLLEDVGIGLNVIDTFSTGYQFQTASISENWDTDADENVLERYRSLECTYAHDGDTFHLFVDASTVGNQLDQVKTAETYKGCDLKYYAYDNKLVPGNYRPNEQDRRDEASGKYVFSYGSEKIELRRVQGLGFEYGGLNYAFSAIDSSVTKDQLIQMAKEVIDHQNGGKDDP